MRALPNAVPLFVASYPLPIIALSVCPFIDSHSVSLPVPELPFVRVFVLIKLKPGSLAIIVNPVSFVNSSVIVDHDAEALSFLAVHLTEIHAFANFILLFVIWHLKQIFYVDQIRQRPVF